MKLKKDRFSIRKFTVGAASVLIGFTFMGAVNSQEVKADTKPVSPEPSPAANEDKGEQKQSDAGAVQAEAETVDPNAHVETERVETQDNQAANVQTATDKENTLKVNSNVDTSAITTEAAKEEKTEASTNLDNERTFKRTINVELPKGRHYADGSNKQSIQQSVQLVELLISIKLLVKWFHMIIGKQQIMKAQIFQLISGIHETFHFLVILQRLKLLMVKTMI